MIIKIIIFVECIKVVDTVKDGFKYVNVFVSSDLVLGVGLFCG